MNDYYDGPRFGIADVDGEPHIYEAEFDHSSDEYGDTYFVSPLDESLLALILGPTRTGLAPVRLHQLLLAPSEIQATVLAAPPTANALA
jgi:hypothetical protein